MFNFKHYFYKKYYIYYMNNLREVSHIDFYHNGGFWGFRTWTLIGYDGDREICRVSKSESNNFLKYVRFVQELKKCGYKLRLCDRERLKGGDKDFMDPALVRLATREHLYEIASYAGYSRHQVDCMPNESEDEKIIFCENVGLERHELQQIIDRW